MHEDFDAILCEVKLLVLDFDGVFTSGHTMLDAQNNRIYNFSIQDGMGLVLLMAAGVNVAVLTSSENDVIASRMERLGIRYLDMGAHNKAEALAKALAHFEVDATQVAYLADDINDIPALKQVGLPCAVSNARQQVKDVCSLHCRDAGGNGAIRELCDALLASCDFDHVELWEKASERL